MTDFYSKITAPVPGDDPFGADVNYDIDYERLKSEMGKLGDIDAEAVETLSVKILTEKSKDARALAFLAYAMLRKGDFGGLADVLGALAVYCQDDFERLYPRREGAKLAALRWFSESRFSGQCDKAAPAAADAQNAARLAEAILNLREALNKRFSDAAPPLSALYRRATEWKKTAENAAAQPAPPPPEPPASAAAANKSANITGENNPKNATDDEYDEILRCIKKVESFIMKIKNNA